MAISDASDFTDGSYFHRVLWDDAQKGHSETKLNADDQIKRVVLCSGKVYYDLLAERDARGLTDTYLLRVEQLYPVPKQSLTAELSRFKGAEWVWCQEEPKNMGAWSPYRAGTGSAADQDRRHQHPRALCRPCGLGLAGDGSGLQAQIRTANPGQRSARLTDRNAPTRRRLK